MIKMKPLPYLYLQLNTLAFHFIQRVHCKFKRRKSFEYLIFLYLLTNFLHHLCCNILPFLHPAHCSFSSGDDLPPPPSFVLFILFLSHTVTANTLSPPVILHFPTSSTHKVVAKADEENEEKRMKRGSGMK